MADSASLTTFTWSRTEAGKRYQGPEAFLCLVSLAAMAGGGMPILASTSLQQLTHRWCQRGVIKQSDIEALNMAVCARLEKGEAALEEAAAALPACCHPSAYAQALDIMLINGSLEANEQVLAQRLVQALNISEDEARFVKTCMVLKNEY